MTRIHEMAIFKAATTAAVSSVTSILVSLHEKFGAILDRMSEAYDGFPAGRVDVPKLCYVAKI